MDMEALEYAAQHVFNRLTTSKAACVLILGSGWSNVADAFEVVSEIPYIDEFGLELRKAIESLLPVAPIIFLAPVVADLFHIGQRRTLGPVVDGLRLGPTCIGEALFQVIELFVGNVDFEGGDLTHGI